MTGRFLTTSDVAKASGITPTAVIRAADEGRITVAARTLSGQRLFVERDVARFLKRRDQPAGADEQ